MENWRVAWAMVATAHRLVTQMDPIGCGLACGEMLLADRGVVANQQELGVGLRLPIDGADLAERMTAVSGLHWLGGAIAGVEPPRLELVVGLLAKHGTWAALLEPQGYRQVGHWVVVDRVVGANAEALVEVRDPIGYAFAVPAADFLRLWHFTSLVIEVAP